MGLGGSFTASVAEGGNPSDIGFQDLIVALKRQALPKLASSLSPLIWPNTVILPAMNGVPWWFQLRGGGDMPPTALNSIDPYGGIAVAIPLAPARGALGEHIATRLGEWGLTPGESDVALFALKGCDIAETARLCGAATGTLRAQLAISTRKRGPPADRC